MSSQRIIFILFSVSSVVFGGAISGEENPEYILNDALNSFNTKLYGKLIESQKGNFVYSPFSLHMILTQTYVGAPTGTVSSKELSTFLGVDQKRNEDYLHNYLQSLESQQEVTQSGKATINIANKLYGALDLKVKQNFKKAMVLFFNSDFQNVNFVNVEDTVNRINDFVKEYTNRSIDNIVSSDDIIAETQLALINAIYFEGKWRNQFQIESTQTDKFHVDSTRDVEYTQMKQKAILPVVQIPELSASAIELPYETNQFSLIIVLPDADSDITQVQSKIGPVNLIADKLRDTPPSPAIVTLPKFEIDFNWKDLQANLQSLGLTSIFDVNIANLTDIADEPIHVSKIAHRAAIKVFEEGSQAAAETGVLLEPIIEEFKNVFAVDRPFLFFIYDKKENFPLFAGRVVDPNGKLELD